MLDHEHRVFDVRIVAITGQLELEAGTEGAAVALEKDRRDSDFLLLEPHGDKLAKLHGSLPFSQLRARYSGPELRALLAAAAGQPPDVSPATFAWSRVPAHDRVARWNDGLVIE